MRAAIWFSLLIGLAAAGEAGAQAMSISDQQPPEWVREAPTGDLAAIAMGAFASSMRETEVGSRISRSAAGDRLRAGPHEDRAGVPRA